MKSMLHIRDRLKRRRPGPALAGSLLAAAVLTAYGLTMRQGPPEALTTSGVPFGDVRVPDTGRTAPELAPHTLENVLSLADPTAARRIQVSPKRRTEIARIDSELDRQARKIMQEAIERWQKMGGFHRERIPDFQNPRSLYGRELDVLRREAAQKITLLLTNEERERWCNATHPVEAQPELRPLAD